MIYSKVALKKGTAIGGVWFCHNKKQRKKEKNAEALNSKCAVYYLDIKLSAAARGIDGRSMVSDHDD